MLTKFTPSQIGLKNLYSIQRGFVYSQWCPNLCYTDKVNQTRGGVEFSPSVDVSLSLDWLGQHHAEFEPDEPRSEHVPEEQRDVQQDGMSRVWKAVLLDESKLPEVSHGVQLQRYTSG